MRNVVKITLWSVFGGLALSMSGCSPEVMRHMIENDPTSYKNTQQYNRTMQRASCKSPGAGCSSGAECCSGGCIQWRCAQ